MAENEHGNRSGLPKADDLADWLIKRFNIQQGYGLARHLGVKSHYSNHKAVYAWVLMQQRSWPTDMRTTEKLRKAFCELIPSDQF